MAGIFTLEHTFDLWIAGLLVTAIVIQGARPRWFASTTGWAYVGGWQREIACFDLALAWILFDLRGQDAAALVLWPFLVLWTLLGNNHLFALLRAPEKPGHWAGAAANGVAIGFAAVAIALR
jgi:hypothetical protein